MKIARFRYRAIRFLKKQKIVSWRTHNHKIELEITTDCNLRCFNCNRSCRQAPSKENMSLEQIRAFIGESKKLKHDWINIALLGGEPTLHPDFFEILSIFEEYKIDKPETRIELVTNGYGTQVKEILKKIPVWVDITNLKKKSNVQQFSSYNMAPLDQMEFTHSNFSKKCEISEFCGLGLTRYGYYGCGPGASVDRVFGFDIGIKSLYECQPKKIRQQLKILCPYCGHYKDRDMWHYNTETEEKISKTWQAIYKKYCEKKPELILY